MDSHALPDDHVLKPLETRMLAMCADMHPAMRVLGGNFVAALRVFANEHPGLVDETWTCERCEAKFESPSFARRGHKTVTWELPHRQATRHRIFDCWVCLNCAKEEAS